MKRRISVTTLVLLALSGTTASGLPACGKEEPSSVSGQAVGGGGGAVPPPMMQGGMGGTGEVVSGGRGGEAGPTCSEGLVRCEGTCINPKTDSAFCGASGNCSTNATRGRTCDEGESCAGGLCRRWGTPTVVGSADYDLSIAGLFASASGWVGLGYYLQGEVDAEVLTRFIAPDSRLWTGPLPVWSGEGQLLRWFRWGLRTDGEAVAAIVRGDPANSGIAYAEWASLTSPSASWSALAPLIPGDDVQRFTFFMEKGGTAHVLWDDSSGGQLVSATALSPGATDWSDVSEVSLVGEGALPGSGVGRAGQAAVTWSALPDETSEPLSFEVMSYDMGAWTPSIRLQNPGTSASSPKATFAENGDLLVAWYQDTPISSRGVWASRRDDASRVWEEPRSVFPAARGVPELVSMSDGTVVCAVVDQDTGKLESATRASGSSEWIRIDALEEASQVGELETPFVRMVVAPDDTLYAGWISQGQAMVTRLDLNDRSWSQPLALPSSAAAGVDWHLNLTADHRGELIAVWEERLETSSILVTARLR